MDVEHLERWCSALADARESAKDPDRYSRAAMLYWLCVVLWPQGKKKILPKMVNFSRIGYFSSSFLFLKNR